MLPLKLTPHQILQHVKKVILTPSVFNITVDENQSIDINDIVNHSPLFTVQDVCDACNSSANTFGLFVEGSRISHDRPIPKIKNRKQPPEILYFHTTSVVWDFFKGRNGIGFKKKTQLIEVSASINPPSFPFGTPMTLIIDAKGAHDSGHVHFFEINQKWHCTFIPAEFILND